MDPDSGRLDTEKLAGKIASGKLPGESIASGSQSTVVSLQRLLIIAARPLGAQIILPGVSETPDPNYFSSVAVQKHLPPLQRK